MFNPCSVDDIVGFQSCLELRPEHPYGEVVGIAELVFLSAARTLLRVAQRHIFLVGSAVGKEEVEVVFIAFLGIHFRHERAHVASPCAIAYAVEYHSPHSILHCLLLGVGAIAAIALHT